jgi:A/G-specific adenine glycosylase
VPQVHPGIQPHAADLLAWYERHGRTLPWRTGPRERAAGVRPEPYRVWLSEVMLQQTTVRAVGPFFARFLERWPTIRDLAEAEDGAVMAAWAGLGYYSRARNLIGCAQAVAARPGGQFPSTAAELAGLPGIGAYTAAAIAALAFDEPVAVVDGNVERVVTRLFAINRPMPAGKTAVRNALQPLVPSDRPGEFAEAMMDLGATICTPKKPACAICPWLEPCGARRQGRQTEFPVKAPRRARPVRFGAAFVARRSDGAILLRRRPPRGLLGGMSEVPGTEWSETGPGSAIAPLEAEWMQLAVPIEHGFTHFELRLSIHRADVAADVAAPGDCWWAAASTLSQEALPNVMKKAIEAAYPGSTQPARSS